MNRKYFLIFGLVILITALLTYLFLFYEKPIQVKVEAYYTGWPNESGPNFLINKVLEGGNNIKGEIQERDILVEFPSERMTDSVENAIRGCAICYDFIFYGELFYRPKSDYSILKVKSFSFSLRNDCCPDSLINKKTNAH